MGRSPIINETVTMTHPTTGAEEELSLTDALCRYLEAGSFINSAAGALGISESSLHNWNARGRDALAVADETGKPVPESEEPYVAFLEATTRAKQRGVVWHELNLKRHAENDPRASMFFLERRAPGQYARAKDVEPDRGGRSPAEIDVATAQEVEAAFNAAQVPKEIKPDDILPALGGGDA